MREQGKSSDSALHGGSTPSRAEITKSLDDGLFELIGEHHHEQVSVWSDVAAGYRGIIAIHNTTLGPALGGTRMWQYENDLEALIDVLRLSRGMTYKAALAGLNLGGGKSVIVGDPKSKNREPIFRAHGRHVQSMCGRYITAEDVGTSPTDMARMKLPTISSPAAERWLASRPRSSSARSADSRPPPSALRLASSIHRRPRGATARTTTTCGNQESSHRRRSSHWRMPRQRLATSARKWDGLFDSGATARSSGKLRPACRLDPANASLRDS